MSDSDSDRTRAAASSSASGMPSSLRQICRTMAALSSSMTKSGRASRARSAKNAVASATDSDGTRQVSSPATLIGSRLVANIVTRGQVCSSALTWPAPTSSRVLAIVEDNEHLPLGQVAQHRIGR